MRKFLLIPALFLVGWFALAGDDFKPRSLWTTSKIKGSPEPPPSYKAARAFEQVKFFHPTEIVFGAGRCFVCEQDGKLHSFEQKPDAKTELVIDLRKEFPKLVKHPEAVKADALYGFAFHPRFAENGIVFLCYTLKGKDGKVHFPDGTRVSRFRMKDNRIDPATEEVVITYREGGHNGGSLKFGPDGMLYISTGDSEDPSPPDRLRTGQDNSDLLSCILRIDVDRKDDDKQYAVPKDNPFIGQKQYDGKEIRPEIWAFGFRNPWRMSFDRVAGDLWVGDVGWELWEMVHKIEKGGNYGWSVMEGPQPINAAWPRGPGEIKPPVIELSHTVAASVTGGYVYRGRKYPSLVGKYIFGDWETRRIWAATVEGTTLKELVELCKPTVRVVAFGEDAAGELFFLDYDTGTVHTLEPNSADPDAWKGFPKKLSDTGLFKDVRKHEVADGVTPFAVQAEQWQDGATAERFVALPGDTFIQWHAEPSKIPGIVDWHKFGMHFPKDAVLVKTIAMELEKGNPATKKRLETQILHFDGEQFQGLTYRWRDDQSDADLVPADGDETEFEVADKSLPFGKRLQTWNFHGRAQCMQCHNMWAESTLGFQPHGLSKDVLQGFADNGMIRGVDKKGVVSPIAGKRIEEVKRLEKPFDDKAPLEARARSYLHTNCGHCHRFGGGGSVQIDLNFEKKSNEMKAMGVKPQQGDFGYKSLIEPGEPESSVMVYRMAKFGAGRMPHLGSEMPDHAGLHTVADWIRNMTPDRDRRIFRNFIAPEDALRLALEWNRLKLEAREAALGSVVVSKGPLHDLLEGYLPQPPGERKLGPNPKPQKILSLKGDAEKGRELFHQEKLQCAACHKIGDKGLNVGPELTKIGATRKRNELLESLLQPSRRIESAYQTILVMTTAGKNVSGIVVRRDAEKLVLKDAKNVETTVLVKDIEQESRSPTSLMPDGLLRDLTPQQAADLLEFLINRK